MINKVIYSFGKCKRCGITTALKEGICYNCEKLFNDKSVFGNIFGDIFGNLFGKNKEE